MTSDNTHIRQLRIRSAGAPAPGRERLIRQLSETLAAADWPGTGGDTWVFIRQLRVQGPARLLPERLLQATRSAVQDGNSADCVRFASLAELLAALLTDLCQGRQHWYWQHWSALFSQARPAALSQLLAQHPELLPSVCARLDQVRQLLPVWQTLDDAGATRLLSELSGRSGLALPNPAQWPALLTAGRRSLHGIGQPLSPSSEPHPSPSGLPARAQPCAQPYAQPPQELPALHPHLQQRWAPLLASLPRATPRYLLALLLAAREAVPLMLQQAPLTALVRLESRLLQRQQPAALTPPGPLSAAATALAPAPVAAAQARVSQPAAPRFTAAPPAAPGTSPTALSTTAPAAPPPTTAAGAVVPPRMPSDLAPVPGSATPPPDPVAQHPAAALRAATTATASQGAAVAVDFMQINTRQGGLLYLLNVLNRAEARSLMRDGWELLPHGWAWLGRLGLELGLDTSDPLAEAIALQLGFDSGAGLAHLPALPGRARLLALTQHWYGAADLWQPALLARAAQVHLSPSHVDMFLPLQAVQLPVRLAGLDINPGWLPWLGKVVGFHYD